MGDERDADGQESPRSQPRLNPNDRDTHLASWDERAMQLRLRPASEIIAQAWITDEQKRSSRFAPGERVSSPTDEGMFKLQVRVDMTRPPVRDTCLCWVLTPETPDSWSF